MTCPESGVRKAVLTRTGWPSAGLEQVARTAAVTTFTLGITLGEASAAATEAADMSSSASEDADEESSSGFGITPFGGITYSPETSLMFGAVAIAYYAHPPEAKRRDSKLMLALAYSLRQQAAVLLGGDSYLLDDRLSVESTVSYSRFPDSFFGVGNDTRLDDEERYTAILAELRFLPKWRVLPRLYLGPGARLYVVRIQEVESGGLLDHGSYRGHEGGHVMELGVGAVYDSRDNTLNPHAGVHVQLTPRISAPELGSDYRSTTTILDARGYIGLQPPNHILALRGYAEYRTGRPPFFDLGRLGGDQLLRGHFQGRYRDRQLLAVQAEYRLRVYGRFGMVGFGGLGEVAPQVSDFELGAIRPSVGGGLRFAPSSAAPVNIRLDFAWAGDQSGFYLNVGEAF